MSEEKLSQARLEKQQIVEQLKEKIQNCQSFVVIDYKGLTAAQDTEFHKAFREQNVEYKVLKNTLFRIALNELNYHEFDELLNGPTAVAFSNEDAVAPAKIAAESVKKYNKMAIKCGMFDKQFASKEIVEQMATIPSKPILLSMLVSVLSAPIRGLAVALNAIAEKQQEA